MPGVKLLNLHGMEQITLPPDIHILHQAWDKYYQRDKFFQGIWRALKRKKYVQHHDHSYFILHEGKVRHKEKICVPKSILRQVLIAIHTIAHPEIDKTMQVFKRKYMVMAKKPVPDCDIKQEVETFVKARKACQAVKHRRGVQPDTMESHPIPGDIFSSIAVDFVSFKGDQVKIRN